MGKSKFQLSLVAQGHAKPITLYGVDASARRLGALISGYFTRVTGFVVEVSSWKTRFEAAWCKEGPPQENLHRCGLRLISDDGNFIKVLARTGRILQ